MSDLKWQTVEQLQGSKERCERSISHFESKVAGQRERLKWINHYLYLRTPQELTMREIEHRLGHKVIIKE
ncbi:hypothetical protein [Marinobacter phage PS6]|nr:hypothetical protein [Marinobacter phage PS6]